jgi:hypothetical protein
MRNHDYFMLFLMHLAGFKFGNNGSENSPVIIQFF